MEIAKGDELMMSTVEMVDSFINDPEVISIFHDDSWKVVSAEQRGKDKGIVEGKTLGLKEGLLKTAKNMLLKNYTPKEISEITNLSISEIKKLKVNQ